MVSKVADDGVADGSAEYGLEGVQHETANVGVGILEKRHQIVERPRVELPTITRMFSSVGARHAISYP